MFLHLKKYALIVSVVFLTACSSVGPKSIKRDRNSYIEALSLTNRQEMLANIVRAKYNEPPVFLKVKTITASPSIELGTGSNFKTGSGSNEVSLSPRIVYKQDPTIFYEPLSGKEFANEMLMPVGLLPLFLMINNGFDITTIADLMFISVNDATNARRASKESRELFRKSTEAFHELFNKKLMMLQVNKKEILSPDPKLHIYLTPQALKSEEFAFIKKNLIVEPKGNLIAIKLGLAGNKEDISVNTRSVLSMINYLSYYVKVPKEHENKVWPSELIEEKPLITIYSSKSRPTDANLSVFLKNHWFYIKDTDIISQNTLYLMHVIFDMQAQLSDSNNLQLTLPVR